MAAELRRVLGVGGAAVVGVGAMLGTGVFAAWTPAIGLAGSALLVSLVVAAFVAALNATSTAALARALPQSGGAYAYGRAYLSRPAGVVAGYSFVAGKAASAGAAALTIGAYAWPGQERLVGLIAVALALALDLRGIVKSMRVSAVLIAVVLVVLGALAVATAVAGPGVAVADPGPSSAWGVIAGAGILFVAFAGYARITVLGEEVRDPARTIPRAMIISFAIIIIVYAALALAVLASVDAGVELTSAPLESIAESVSGAGLAIAVRVAAVIAAGAVLLSLLAGIGRTLFAMGRGGDAPSGFTAVSVRAVPWRADVAAAVLAAGVVIVGGIGFALALSAGLVLTYYGIAHASVLVRVGRGDFPRTLGLSAALGMVGCLVVVAGLLVAAMPG
jgi:APA family basic amino acid/polyamine antiporter